jgi:hypothetical protein
MLSLAISAQWTVTFIMFMASAGCAGDTNGARDPDSRRLGSERLQHERWEDDPAGVGVDDRVAVIGAHDIGELIPHSTYSFERPGIRSLLTAPRDRLASMRRVAHSPVPLLRRADITGR